MRNKKNDKNIRETNNMFERFTATLICVIMVCFFTAGYAMTLYDSVIMPFISDSLTTYTNTDKIDKITSIDSIEVKDLTFIDMENPETMLTEKGRKETESAEEDAPSISIGSINAEHKDDPDYVTYDINITSATYTVEEDGELVKKEFPNVTGGTISIKKFSTIEENSNNENEPDAEPDTDNGGNETTTRFRGGGGGSSSIFNGGVTQLSEN